MKPADDIEGSDGLAEEDKDFLKCLEMMAKEIDGEADSCKQYAEGSKQQTRIISDH